MSNWVRQAHRWVSLAFTVAVVVNLVANLQQEPPIWVGLLALLPLLFLLFTGLYMFVLPYTAKGRSNRPPAQEVMHER